MTNDEIVETYLQLSAEALIMKTALNIRCFESIRTHSIKFKELIKTFKELDLSITNDIRIARFSFQQATLVKMGEELCELTNTLLKERIAFVRAK